MARKKRDTTQIVWRKSRLRKRQKERKDMFHPDFGRVGIPTRKRRRLFKRGGPYYKWGAIKGKVRGLGERTYLTKRQRRGK